MSTIQNVAEPVSPELAAAQQIMQLSTGYIMSTALHAAVRLKLADRIGDGHVPVQALARETRANEDALYRVLRLLASVGVFEEGAPREFGHTPPPRCFVRTCQDRCTRWRCGWPTPLTCGSTPTRCTR